jgi:hypothetical protein
MLELRLYDGDGSVDIKFLQTGYEEPAGVTQPEINRLVQSLHKAPSQLAATTAKINNSN